MTLVLLLSVGCSDVNFHPRAGDPDGGDDSTAIVDSTAPTTDTGCDKLGLPSGTVAIDENCKQEGIFGTFEPVVKWHNSEPGDVTVTPAVGELTDDNADGLVNDQDDPDIVVANLHGGIFALDGTTGALLWQSSVLVNGEGTTTEPTSPAIGDIDGDGFPDVVVAASNDGGKDAAGRLVALEGRTGDVEWLVPTPYTSREEHCGAVNLYDLDGNGTVEVLLGAWIANGADGSTVGLGTQGTGTGYASDYVAGWHPAMMSAAADIDRDGKQEVVTGNTLYDSTGNTIWANAEKDGFVAIGDFDGDPYGEIIATSYPSEMRLQDDDGSVIWKKELGGLTIGPPTIADFDGDGEPEIGVAGQDSYRVVDADGRILWSRTTTDFSSGFTGSSVFDFEGDGAAEVVYADEKDVWVFDGATGDVKLQEEQHTSVTCSEYPTIADVDADGHAEIVVTDSAYKWGTDQGVTVIEDADDSWMPAPVWWNQHDYAITNVGANGVIPAQPDVNWDTYNSFRSGDLIATAGSVMADPYPLLDETCLLDCADGIVRVSVQLANGGVYRTASGVPISAYAETAKGGWALLETKRWNGKVEPGTTSDGIDFKLDAAKIETGRVQFVANDDGNGGTLAECDPKNDLLEVDGLTCP
jgi:hypothetical protein